jgi:FkbM family methyltransferase
MRKELFYNPLLLLERLGEFVAKKRRMSKINHTVAQDLAEGHIDSLELLELIAAENIKTVYDIGANIGTWSLLAQAILKPDAIHAFEPLPNFHPAFIRNTQKLTNIHLHKIALGAKKDTLLMNIASDSSSFLPLSEFQQTYFDVNKQGETKIDILPLDDYVTTNNLAQADLIKLDIQGYELEALKGAINLLQHTKYILCELSFVEFYIGQPLFHEIVAFLASHNFYSMAIKKHTHTGTRLYQTDVLFEKR